jgi:hypothetical protein
MTYGELIMLLRQDYLNDVADAPDIPEEDYLWPTDFLTRSLFEAERQVCRRKMDMIYDEETASIVHPTIVANSRTMTLDERVIDVAWMTIGTSHERKLVKTTRERLDQDEPMWRNYTEATYPTKFFIFGRKVYWNYLPDATCSAETCNLGVWRYPLREKDLEEEPEVSGHRDLIHWVLFECYSKDDGDSHETRSDDKAQKHLALFNQAFGVPIRHDVLEAKKEGPRYFSMVGPDYFGKMGRRGTP